MPGLGKNSCGGRTQEAAKSDLILQVISVSVGNFEYMNNLTEFRSQVYIHRSLLTWDINYFIRIIVSEVEPASGKACNIDFQSKVHVSPSFGRTP